MRDSDRSILMFMTKKSRLKAKKAAIAEVYFALKSCDGIFLMNGPLGNIKGLFSFSISSDILIAAEDIVKGLGYVSGAYILSFDSYNKNNTNLIIKGKLVWKKKSFSIDVFYEEDKKKLRSRAPDKRSFRIIGGDGKVRDVIGYRGDGSDTGKRGLPTEDCRLLINLAMPKFSDRILDPFAGGGGIIFEAMDSPFNLKVYSSDIDPILSPGLKMLGAAHTCSDVCDLDFQPKFFDFISTEVPFSENANENILKGMDNLHDMLNSNGRLVIMCAKSQHEIIKDRGDLIFGNNYFDMIINRKGKQVAIMAWAKFDCTLDAEFIRSLKHLY